KELLVRADQDVLAVVERLALRYDAPRAASRDRSGLEHGHRDSAFHQSDRGGHSRVTRSDNGYAVTQVLHAGQNLRSGVSEVRRVRTLKPSRSISSSRVR